MKKEEVKNTPQSDVYWVNWSEYKAYIEPLDKVVGVQAIDWELGLIKPINKKKGTIIKTTDGSVTVEISSGNWYRFEDVELLKCCYLRDRKGKMLYEADKVRIVDVATTGYVFFDDKDKAFRIAIQEDNVKLSFKGLRPKDIEKIGNYYTEKTNKGVTDNG